jgi:F-type H+-transporting ATPase subunit epsilon
VLHLEIITPDRTVFEGDCDSVSLPTPQGEITILSHHIPIVSIVSAGTVIVRRSGAEDAVMSISRGVVEVDGSSLRILADTAERAEELEEEAITKAKAEAEKAMREKRHDREGFAEATAILERELARLRVVRRRRARRTG